MSVFLPTAAETCVNPEALRSRKSRHAGVRGIILLLHALRSSCSPVLAIIQQEGKCAMCSSQSFAIGCTHDDTRRYPFEKRIIRTPLLPCLAYAMIRLASNAYSTVASVRTRK